MMASGEIGLLPMTMRRMPVLAQSQNSMQSSLSDSSAGGTCDATCQSLQITVTGHYMDAPDSPTPTGVNLAPLFGPNFSQYNPMRAGLQTLGVGIGGAALAVGGVALAPALKGPALGALMELSGSSVNTYAAQNVLTVIETEGYAEFLEGVNTLGEALKSLEQVEVTGPEILW